MSARLLYSVEAEQAVIGALLLNNDAIDSVGDLITHHDFYIGANKASFKAISEIIADGRKADVVSLIERMELDGTLRDEDRDYLVACLTNTSGANARQYAQIVLDRSLERKLLAASNEISELSRAMGPVQERMDQAQRLVMEITESASRNEPRSASEILASYIGHLETRMEKGGEITGIPTGLKDLDKKLSGLQEQQLIIIAGRPGMGKSALALQVAIHEALHGGSPVVFSMEMSAEEMMARSISMVGKINGERLRNADIKDEDWDRISSTIGRLNETKLLIDDSSALSMEQLSARCRRIKRQQGLTLVVVDYLQLMTGEGENRNQQIESITRRLKGLAKELKVPVIALSQLSRKCEERGDKRPIPSDLRESGGIEQDADVIVFIYRDEVYDVDTQHKGIAELIVAKQRGGTTGTVASTFLGEYSTFADTEWKRPETAMVPQKKRRMGHDFG